MLIAHGALHGETVSNWNPEYRLQTDNLYVVSTSIEELEIEKAKSLLVWFRGNTLTLQRRKT
jgi:hypothetical protein